MQPEYEVPARTVEEESEVQRTLRPRVFLRPIGNPMPLGFLGLTVATVTMAALNIGWIPLAQQSEVGIVLIAFAFPTQATATVFGFLARDAVVASGIGVQAASWLTIGVLLVVSPPGHENQALAFFLFVAASALLSAVLVSVQAKVVPALVMGGTVVRYALTGVAEHFGSVGWTQASGYEGLVLAALALYAAIAIDLESSNRKPVLPLVRHGHGRIAVSGSAMAQVSKVHHEAGVREEL